MQRIKAFSKKEVDDTVSYFESQGLSLVKRGSSYINHETLQYWAIMDK